MKICICADGYPSMGLQYSAFIQVLARELVRQNNELMVIAPQSLTNHYLRGGKLAPRYFEDQVNVDGKTEIIKIYRPYTITFGEGKLGRLTPLFNRFATELAIKSSGFIPDVFYSHFWHNGFNAVRIADKMNKPLFVATGEDKITIQNFISQQEISHIQEYTNGVICVSTKNMNDSVNLGFTTKDKCIVLPNAYDPKEFYRMEKSKAREDLGIEKEDFVVSFCGRFNKRKGAMRVAEAIRRLSNPRIKSIFIGSVADNETETPQCDGIVFKGSLPHDQIVKYLNASDVFVLPSLAEGCPNSVIEAMACGLPIISSDLPFNYDILNDKTGLLVNPDSVEEISDAILTLYNDTERRDDLAKCSVQKSELLTITKRVNSIVGFIKDRI